MSKTVNKETEFLVFTVVCCSLCRVKGFVKGGVIFINLSTISGSPSIFHYYNGKNLFYICQKKISLHETLQLNHIILPIFRSSMNIDLNSSSETELGKPAQQCSEVTQWSPCFG